MPPSVILLHQNRLIRETLAKHLARDQRIGDAAAVSSGPELIRACAARRPDAVVLDADTNRWSTEGLVSLIERSAGHPRVIAVYDSLPVAHIVRAYESGVSALIPHSSGIEALLDAVAAPALPVEVARARGRDGNPLTERNLRVLYLTSAGVTPGRIAVELGISRYTVEYRKQRILTELCGDTPAVLEPDPKPAQPQRGHVGVRLAEPAGPLAVRIRRTLHEQRIPVLDGHDGLVTVMVDPKPDDLPAPDAADGKIVVVTSRTPSRAELLMSMARRVATLPAARLDDLLVPTIWAVSRGYAVLDAECVAPTGWQNWELTLTPREKQILASISQGHATKQTARLLGISAKTVENLQGNLFRKLGVHNKASALAAAHNLGLLHA